MALERRQRAGLVRAHQAAVADHVGGEDGGETTFHVSSPWRGRLAALGGQKSMPLRRHLNVRVWLCVTSIAGPNGGAQLYER